MSGPRRIGFIGLGNMGGRMTRRLVDHGHPVIGFDPVPGRAARAGAAPAASVAEVAGGSDCILLSLPDSSVIESVVLGPGGLVEVGRPGQVIADLSTAAPSSTSGCTPPWPPGRSTISTLASPAARGPPSRGRSRSWSAAGPPRSTPSAGCSSP